MNGISNNNVNYVKNRNNERSTKDLADNFQILNGKLKFKIRNL